MALTLETVLTRYHALTSFWRQFRNDCRVYNEAYFQQHWTSELAEGDYQATLPIETLVIDTALAMLTSAEPVLTIIPPDGATERQRSDADRAERWHLGVDYQNTRIGGEDVNSSALFNSLLYGLGWIREVASFPPDWLTADPDPDSLHYQFPLIKQSVHPLQVMFRPGRAPGGISHLAYEGDYTVDEIESEWGKRLSPPRDAKGQFLQKDPMEVRRAVEYWEWVNEAGKPTLYHCVFTTGPEEWVKRPTPMPEYKRIPYYKIPCYETQEYEPHKRYLSMLFKLREIPHLTEIVVSRELRMAEMYIDPIIIAQSANGTPIPIVKQPGGIVDIGPEDSIKYLQYSGTPPDLPRVRELLLNMGYLAGFPPATYAQGSGDSAMARTMDVEQSLFKIASPARHYRAALEDLYWHRAQLMCSFSNDVSVPVSGLTSRGEAYAIKRTGEQLVRHATVMVKIRPGLYSRMLADINIATQAVNAGVWDLDTAMDFLGVQDKQRVRDGRKRDLVEFNPNAIALETEVYNKDLMAELQPDASQGAIPPGQGIPALLGAANTPGQSAPGGTPAAPPGAQPLVQGVSNSLNGAVPPTPGATPSSAPLSPGDMLMRQLASSQRQGRPRNGSTIRGG